MKDTIAALIGPFIAVSLVLYFGASLFLPYFFVFEGAKEPGYLSIQNALLNILMIVVGYYFGSNEQKTKPTEAPKDGGS